jgi:PAS domain S-box-containing protein
MGESSSLSDAIVEQAADAIIYADASGTIVCWNHAAAALFGYAPAAAIGRNLDMIIPEHLRAPHWQGFEAAMASGKTRLSGAPTVTRAVHETGRKLYVEMTFAVVTERPGGPGVGAVVVARDVTERVEKERAARRAAPG